MFFRKSALFVFVLTVAAAFGCSGEPPVESSPVISSLKEVPASRLNYRYEPDVPQPEDPSVKNVLETRNEAVQAHFDQTRPNEILSKTVSSSNGKNILAVYHKLGDQPQEYRLDMYSSDGTLLRKITADGMAAHFPDTIVWSPDSSTLAFVAKLRTVSIEAVDPMAAGPSPTPVPSPEVTVTPLDDQADVANPEASPTGEVTQTVPEQTPEPPENVLTFRTEQLYTCNADGTGLKPLTQSEGLIYFYYVWAPDSSALAALAATAREWQYLEYRAENEGAFFIPMGRPRIIEKNGRERRLDDGLTAVQPVWSPDSAKVASAFETQIRVYDAVGDAPTQAAIPLRNNLLLSSQAFDKLQNEKLGDQSTPDAANAPAPANTQPQQPTTLPDEKSLVSFNPIVALKWLSDDQLYLNTAYVKKMRDETDSAVSFSRWHRLFFTPQPSLFTSPQ